MANEVKMEIWPEGSDRLRNHPGRNPEQLRARFEHNQAFVHDVSRFDYNAVVQRLKRGESPNCYDDQGRSALLVAVAVEPRSVYLETGGWTSAPPLVSTLLNRGADPDIVDPHSGDSALHIAAREDRLALLDIILDHGANPNLINRNGEAPLDLCHESPIYDSIFGTLVMEGAQNAHQILEGQPRETLDQYLDRQDADPPSFEFDR